MPFASDSSLVYLFNKEFSPSERRRGEKHTNSQEKSSLQLQDVAKDFF